MPTRYTLGWIFLVSSLLALFVFLNCSSSLGGNEDDGTNSGTNSDDDTTPKVTGITLTPESGVPIISTYSGTLRIKATVSPENAEDKTVTWSVQAMTGYATIDESGLLKAKLGGEVIVKAIAHDGSQIEGSLQITIAGNPRFFGEGYYYKDGQQQWCYWNGVTRTDITDASWIMDIFASGEDVYLAGKSVNGACYWKGTTKTDLPGATNNSSAAAIFVSEGTIYTAGRSGINDEDGKSIGCFWIGTERTDYDRSYEPQDLAVSNGLVYTAGYYEESSWARTPVAWKNTTMTELQNGSDTTAEPNALFVSTIAVYTAGSYGSPLTKACYWNGAERILLPGDNGGVACDILIVDDKTYVAGYYNQGTASNQTTAKACYWIDGTKYDLSEPNIFGDTFATNVFIFDNQICYAGRKQYGTMVQACIWVGSDRIDFPINGFIYNLVVR